MIENARAVDLIERAQDANPYCACGRHTTPVWRDGAVWLECSSFTAPPEGRLHRLMMAALTPAHTHEWIVDVPPATTEPVLAAPS